MSILKMMRSKSTTRDATHGCRKAK
jgi:hypothetical protein